MRYYITLEQQLVVFAELKDAIQQIEKTTFLRQYVLSEKL